MNHRTKIDLIYFGAYLLMVGLAACAVFWRFQQWTVDWPQFNK